MGTFEKTVKVTKAINDEPTVESQMTLGELVGQNAGSTFKTMDDVIKMRSNLFKNGVYRFVGMDSDGNELFFKCELK